MIIAATGHRPTKLGGYSMDALKYLRDIMVDFITKAGNVDTVISGMAIGWDTAVALATLQTKKKLICAIPFKGQEGRWPEESQYLYNQVLERATEVTIVCEGGYESWKMQRRNEWMVDNSEAIVAMWDGSVGGTANCIRYARQQDKLAYNLYKIYKQRTKIMSVDMHIVKWQDFE